MSKTIQTGARNVTQTGLAHYKNAKIFRGVTRADGDYLRDFDQFIGGYGHFVWLQLPVFLDQIAVYKELSSTFKNLTMAGFKSLSGIDDVQLDMLDVEGGVAGNKVRVAGNARDTFEEFSIKVYEYLGSPMREYMDLWLNGIRDFKTGYAHYQGVFNMPGGTHIREYSNVHHTGVAMYILTDPTGRSYGLEYACLLSNIVPTKVPKSHLNYDSGDHNLAELELTFSANKDEGPAINEAAAAILTKIQKYNVQNYYDQQFQNSAGKKYSDDSIITASTFPPTGKNGEDYSK